jgi:hypothetical protein
VAGGCLLVSACQGANHAVESQMTGVIPSSPWSCVDAAWAPVVLPDIDAGPEDVAPMGVSPATNDGAADEEAGADAASMAPVPVNWCYTDSDCSAFPDSPYCDPDRCSAGARAVDCDAPTLEGPGSTEVRHTFTGSNGTFTDACDAQGNLFKYSCEEKNRCVGMTCAGPIYTGRVNPPQLVDCLGTCRGGRCLNQCPQAWDLVAFVALDGASVIVQDATDGHVYRCSFAAGTPCATNGGCVGQAGIITSGALAGLWCTATDFGVIEVTMGGPTPIDLECGVVPPCAGP